MKVLVTGATGFLGGATARRLAKEGHRVVATGRSLVAGERLQQDGIEFHPADIRDAALIDELTHGCEGVVHCAALSSPWGRASEFDSINRTGTENITAACLAQGISRLVHISTPGIYVGLGDRFEVGENAELPKKPANHYVRTKLAAEVAVGRAQAEGLNTIILRPRGIYGPGDTVVIPRLIKALETGRLPRIGNGQASMDLTYIDNAVQAVCKALRAKAELGGRVFNVTDGSPIELWPFVDRLCESLGLEQPSRTVPLKVATSYAFILELVHTVLFPNREPLMTRYTATLLARSLTLDISAARKDLGYAPTVGPDEGLERFTHWWKASGA